MRETLASCGAEDGVEAAVEPGPDAGAAPVVVIEEPLAAGDRTGMASLFRETGIPVILDESLLRAGQVAGLDEGIGWRINLRVSKLGGLVSMAAAVSASAATT